MLIGLDLGGTKIEAAAIGGDGTTLTRLRVSTPQGDYEKTVRAARGLVERLETEFGVAAGVGFGVPGSVSPATGLMRNANSTCLNGRPLKRDLEAALSRPIRIENDANCLAVSEAVDGAGAGFGIVFAAILGTGCGAGVAIEGRGHSGRNGVAGEFGHNPLPRASGPAEIPGPRCWCGRLGCVETYLSGAGFAALYAAEVGKAASPQEIAGHARLGDVAARRSLDRYIDRLGRTLASVVNVLDPNVIVLGGGLSNIAELYPALPSVVAAHAFSDVCDTPIRPAKHGDSSGVHGAAWLWKG